MGCGTAPEHLASCGPGCRQAEGKVAPSSARERRSALPLASDGWPTAYCLLRKWGWSVNHQREQRIWHEGGQQRPAPRTGNRARPADGSVRCPRAGHHHQVWAMDVLAVLVEFTTLYPAPASGVQLTQVTLAPSAAQASGGRSTGSCSTTSPILLLSLDRRRGHVKAPQVAGPNRSADPTPAARVQAASGSSRPMARSSRISHP